MKIIVIIFMVILFPIASYCDESKMDNADTLQDTTEFGFGPASCPDLEVSENEFNKRIGQLDSLNTDSDFLYELAYLALYMDSLDISEDYFIQSKNHDNFSIQYYKTFLNYWLGYIYEHREKYETAQEYYIKHGDRYYIHLIQAKIYQQSGDMIMAEQEYLDAKSVKLFEYINCEPYWLLAQMFIKADDCSKAKNYLDQYVKCCNVANSEFEPFESNYIPSTNELEEIRNKIKKCK